MRERAQAATAGPWERPLDTRYKNLVIAALPDGEQGQHVSGRIPAEWSSHKGLTGRYADQRERVCIVSAAIYSIGGFMRKRSGRDLDYIAGMHPGVALAVADWLDKFADPVYCYGPVEYDAALRIARAYLGTEVLP